MLLHQFSSLPSPIFFFFFFNDTATTEIYTLSLHDALPISLSGAQTGFLTCGIGATMKAAMARKRARVIGILLDVSCENIQLSRSRQLSSRSEEHTSELQSRLHLVCRLLLEKKKKQQTYVLD